VFDEPSKVLIVIETVKELVVPVKVIVGFHWWMYVIVCEIALVILQDTVLTVWSLSVDEPPPVFVVEKVKVVLSSHQSLQEVYNPDGVLEEPSNVRAVIEVVKELVVPVKVIVGFHWWVYVIVAEKALDTVHDLVETVCNLSVAEPPPVFTSLKVSVVPESHQSDQLEYRPLGVLPAPFNVLAVIEVVKLDVVPARVIVGWYCVIQFQVQVE
jgi:hypothetical protein